jgi:hypothetical protein
MQFGLNETDLFEPNSILIYWGTKQSIYKKWRLDASDYQKREKKQTSTNKG